MPANSDRRRKRQATIAGYPLAQASSRVVRCALSPACGERESINAYYEYDEAVPLRDCPVARRSTASTRSDVAGRSLRLAVVFGLRGDMMTPPNASRRWSRMRRYTSPGNRSFNPEFDRQARATCLPCGAVSSTFGYGETPDHKQQRHGLTRHGDEGRLVSAARVACAKPRSYLQPEVAVADGIQRARCACR